jgi:Icc-related predicted phosphoesterase
MIRIAAAGDVHYGRSSAGRLAPYMSHLNEVADLFLLAGDLTHFGTREEMEVLAKDLAEATVPVISVFGNHDYHSNQTQELRDILQDAGVRVLEQTSCVLELAGSRVGIVGLKGFGGGFAGACGTEFGEPEMKAFIGHTKRQADRLRQELMNLQADYKIALLHYSPCPETLAGEKKEIYPFLGSYLLAEAIDDGGADIAFHGHAHHGIEKGLTPGGVPVRNVAQPVIRHAYNIYTLNKEGLLHTSNASTKMSQAVQGNVTA